MVSGNLAMNLSQVNLIGLSRDSTPTYSITNVVRLSRVSNSCACGPCLYLKLFDVIVA